MGNRDDLLAGAKRCLYAKGYAATTARDIAAEAGVSLAAIGYHYGTKDALLNAALMQALQEWGEQLGAILASRPDADAPPAQRFAAAWAAVARSFADNRPLWSIQFELLSQLDRDPDLRQTFADANRGARLALAELFDFLGDGDERQRLRLGTFYQAMLGGVAAQWLVDPDTALTGPDMIEAMRTLAPALHP